MATHFGLISSLLRHIILTKDKIKEVEMKCGVQAAKRGGGIDAATPTALYFLQIHSTAGDSNGKVVYLENVLSPEEAS